MNYTPPQIDYKKKRRKITIPDQSLSIQQIVERYVRGIPVDVIQRKGVFIDQSDEDLEKISRMDFHEKSEYAKFLQERAAELKATIDEAQRLNRDAKAKRLSELEQQADARAAKAAEKWHKRQPSENQDGVN